MKESYENKNIELPLKNEKKEITENISQQSTMTEKIAIKEKIPIMDKTIINTKEKGKFGKVNNVSKK